MHEIEKKILNKIDEMRDEIIDFHQKLVQIPSINPPGKYRKISKLVEAKMKEIGLKTQVKSHNVIGEMGAENGLSLILYGHLDTVETFSGWIKDPFKGEIIENKLYGRGAADNKASVTAEIFAAKALIEAEAKLSGKLILTAAVDEELGGLRGVQSLLKRGIVGGNACLLGDGPADYPVGYSSGAIFVIFLIKGKQTHMKLADLSSPNRNEYSGVNAIQKMIEIMNFLTDLQKEFNETETKYPILPDAPSKVSYINLAVINGGTRISIVPDKCLLQVAICTIPELDVEQIKRKIIEFVEHLRKEDPDLDISVQIPVSFGAELINPNSYFAKIVSNSMKTVFKEAREFKLHLTATDAHHFQERGIETIIYGAHRAENNIHAKDEFVYIDDLLNTTKVFAITALNYLK